MSKMGEMNMHKKVTAVHASWDAIEGKTDKKKTWWQQLQGVAILCLACQGTQAMPVVPLLLCRWYARWIQILKPVYNTSWSIMRLENSSHQIVLYALLPPDALMFIRLFLTPGEVEVPRFSTNTTFGMLDQLGFIHWNNHFLRQLHQK